MSARRWFTAAAIIAAAPAVAALLRRRFGRREPRRDDLDEVEEAGLDSFPASDPPGWTLGQEE